MMRYQLLCIIAAVFLASALSVFWINVVIAVICTAFAVLTYIWDTTEEVG